MKHIYSPNPNPVHNSKCLDNTSCNCFTRCIECGYQENMHGENSTCECCDKIGNVEPMLVNTEVLFLVENCYKREHALLETQLAVNKTLEDTGISPFGIDSEPENRVIQNHAVVGPYQKLINDARKIDESLHLSSDIFTARTVAINEIREAIWKDNSIPSDGKFFELVRVCKERVAHFQSVIFDLDKKKIEAYSEQKAWHIYMNQYAVHLRSEERERLRIADITYDVKVPKQITPKAVKLNKTKVSEEEIRSALKELYKELGAPESAVMSSANFRSMFLVSKNLTVEEGIKRLRVMLKTSLSED